MDMPASSSGLLRTGLALKLSQVKLAMRSYLRDRTRQATDTVVSYAVAAGLFATAGIFVIAAFLVGLAALFPAFGGVGGLLLAFAAICAALAAGKLKRPEPGFPSLTSRLRVAIKANPLQHDQIEAARDTAETILLAPEAPASRSNRRRPQAARRADRNIKAGVILATTLLGWAVVRRRQQARRTAL
jgi:hypothetical protein